MYYDDLPIWGFIGKVEKILHPGDRTEYKYYLFTHIHFDILYNGKRVIEARSSCVFSMPFVPGVVEPTMHMIHTPTACTPDLRSRCWPRARCCQHSCLIGVSVVLWAACV